MTFLRSPGFPTPTELAAWLLERGIAPIDWRFTRGPDRMWRGSGLLRHLQERHGVNGPAPVVQFDGVAP